MINHHTGTTPPTLFEQCVGSLTSHISALRRGLWFTVLVREDLKVQPFTAVITKAAPSPQVFKDHEYWSGRGLNLRPSAQQSGALPTELTGWRCTVLFAIFNLTYGILISKQNIVHYKSHFMSKMVSATYCNYDDRFPV